MTKMTTLADLALPVPIASTFTYAVPDAMRGVLVVGERVLCRFRGRPKVGVVLRVHDGEPPPKVQPLLERLDETPAFLPELVAFLEDVAEYYFAPIGEVVRLALPPTRPGDLRTAPEPSLFAEPVRRVGVQWAVPTEQTASDGLSGQAAAILASLRATGPEPVSRLTARWGNARSALKKLGSLGLAAIEMRAAPDRPFFETAASADTPFVLTDPQKEAGAAIEGALRTEGIAQTFVLHGVTGSGKTEIYLQAIAVARACGRGAIVLVPEIALTPQLIDRFRARFGDDLAILHSGLTPRERTSMWRKLQRGDVDVAVGARSALFAPVRNLGLILVDEEHDSSFKQEEGVRYHARDMAILRSHRARGVCVLGSATPSLESMRLVHTGKAKLLKLPDRTRAQAMPKVHMIDLRRIGAGPTGDARLSLPLHRAIEETLAAQKQTILFLNRRGFAPSVRCVGCGALATCPLCSVALTFHKRAGGLIRCHYCEHYEPMRTVCTACGDPSLVLEGLGTEKLEETLRTAFPSARVARLDRDVAGPKAVAEVLGRMNAGEIDVLVGTQMVTKGHDLPNVTLVGVINADAALSIPDFRAAERAFQLLVQVAGRAGRGDAPGRVFVQTYDPEHFALAFAAKHDVDGFIARELVDRQELGYPPFSRTALVRIDAVEEEQAREAAGWVAARARRIAAAMDGTLEILGPAPAPLARLRNRFRFRVMLRSARRGPLRHALSILDRERTMLHRTVRMIIDVDPVQLL